MQEVSGQKKKRIGLLGGTFDPVHYGHLRLADTAYAELGLDSVVLMVAPDPPHKQDKQITGLYHRLEMARKAVNGHKGLDVSMYEATLPQPSYTAQTLTHLTRDFPDTEFYFIIGEDSLDHIESWYQPEVIMELATLVAAGRKEDDDDRTVHEQADHLKEKYGARIIELPMELIDISSTEIRRKASAGESISEYVPVGVEYYIKQNHLY